MVCSIISLLLTWSIHEGDKMMVGNSFAE